MKVKSLSRVRLLATPWTTAHQALRPWDFPGKSTGVGPMENAIGILIRIALSLLIALSKYGRSNLNTDSSLFFGESG